MGRKTERINKLESNYDASISGRHKPFPSGSEVFRQEISKIVHIIADRRSIPSLISLLEDKESDIRWIAAESLIKIGRKSIIPLMRSIQAGKVCYYPGNGAWHVLQSLLTRTEKKALHNVLFNLNRPSGTTDINPLGSEFA